VPDPLFHQLASHGTLVAPVGPVEQVQTLVRYRLKRGVRRLDDAREYDAQALGGCYFVPMIDERGQQR
jgi:protein-L-isoaspartate O-methyltransferase